MNILFMDNGRQAEIELFYEASQRHRDFYRGHGKAYHPLTYFKEPEYIYQCPREMTEVYLSYPAFHVRYKQPAVLAQSTGRTSGFPPLPARTLAGRYNKAACKRYVR